MVRTAIRVSMHLNIAKGQYDAWKAFHGGNYPRIHITGLRNRSCFVPGTPNEDATGFTADIPVATAEEMVADANLARFIVAGEYGELKVYDDSVTVFVERLIFPELVFTPVSAHEKALRLSMNFENALGEREEKSAIMYDPDAKADYTVPRNSWLWVDGRVDNEMTITTRVLPWNGADIKNIDDENYRFTIDREILVFTREGGREEVSIFADHPEGWNVESSTVPAWISSLTPDTGASKVETPVTITASANSGDLRKAEIVVRAGNLLKKITVIQLPAGDITEDSPAPANVKMYVGAFWKADQYGERLIRIARPTGVNANAIDGDWIATVVEGEDWIVLDKAMTKDRNVGWRTDVSPSEASVDNGNDDGFDFEHRVNSTETTVNGRVSENTPDGIYFRIGLNSQYTPAPETPARYGQVLLIYTNGGEIKFQRIWIRQGEGADYLISDREKSVKFSPYNLSVPEARLSEFDTQGYTQLDLHGGVPAAYPSQAGAFFQFSSRNSSWMRRAFHPSNPKQMPSWDSSGFEYDASTMETCPEGYRRPTNDQAMSEELGQSLLKNTGLPAQRSGNSVFGYYADGFFDRRRLDTQTNGTSNVSRSESAVAVDTKDVAYNGTLFYSDTNNASIFFPAAGEHDTYGRLNLAGDYGYYISSSMNTSNSVYNFNLIFNNDISTNLSSPHRTYSVRCVKDEVTTRPTDGIPAPPGILGVNARTGELTLKGSRVFDNTPVEQHSEFGEVSPDDVYVSYFKWGSTIAVNSGAQGDRFDLSDIVWVPESYDAYALREAIPTQGWRAWNPNNTSPETITTGWPVNEANGWGDPCVLADNGAWPDYMVPIGGKENGGWNNGMFTTYAEGKYRWSDNGWSDVYVAGVRGFTKDYSMFLQVAMGFRVAPDSSANQGLVQGQSIYDIEGGRGMLWSSTSGEGAGMGLGQLLDMIGDGGTCYSTGYARAAALPVRCVRRTEP